MKIDNLTPEQRTQALYYYFGWNGGTVHQLANETGLDVNRILTGEHGPERLSGGMSAIRTCGREWRVKTLAPKHKGDWPYWRDAIVGFWITGPLG